MSFFVSVYNLLFDQQTFFAQNSARLTVPVILTILYSVISAVFAIPILLTAASAIPGDFTGLMVGVGTVSTIISGIITWVAVSALFFACLKFIGYAECSFSQILSVCGYVSGLLIVQAVLTGLVSFIGTPAPVLLLLLKGVFLLWSIPVWYFGFSSVCDIPEKKLRTAVAVPVIVMAAFTIISSAGTILAF
ncbi:MAG: YIP1 family protein [Methanocorpusculum sp.]|nr:YIP1 family protein [Oscillospiraceae bacterium]MBQ3569674.1 YIP1 family protein [Methanocorpusculum sp.]